MQTNRLVESVLLMHRSVLGKLKNKEQKINLTQIKAGKNNKRNVTN